MLAAYFFGNIYKPGVLLENLHLSRCFLGKSSRNDGFFPWLCEFTLQADACLAASGTPKVRHG
jgi:hypothetical protein